MAAGFLSVLADILVTNVQAVKTTGCTVDTLTLSIEQKVLAEARIAAAGLTDHITVHLLDYRSLPESFKFVSGFFPLNFNPS